METCQNCRFWKVFQLDEWEGTCRRFPPEVFLSSDGVYDFRQPTTQEDDWCGAYERNKELREGEDV
jgi:hypothetical protein